MRRLGLFLFLFVAVFRATAQTPNIALVLPPAGSNAWNIPLNYDFTRLDLLLSGNLALPGLSISGNMTVTGSVTAGSFTGVGGGTFPTISGSPATPHDSPFEAVTGTA